MRVYFTNLGCKLNQAEVEAMGLGFRAAGHRVVERLAEADVHVINSCTVTAEAASESRRRVRRSRREHPGVRTVLAGCYVSGEPERAAALAEADLVVPNQAKPELVRQVEQAFGAELDGERVPGLPYGPLEGGHARAMVKIGDGCNFRCAFCIIPRTRGRESSRPAEDVIAEVAGRVAAGYREVVLTGVQISDWKAPGATVVGLVEQILARTRVERLRVTSVAPWGFDPRWRDLLREPRFCRHLHLSLQSGASDTLRRMRRPYTAAEYAELVEGLVAAVPGLAITTDVIVGFPGESQAEFTASLARVASLPLARVHVFPYSARPGTAAASWPQAVHGSEVRRRMAAMLEVAEQVERRFADGQRGALLPVLWETEHAGQWQGHADNYLRVATSSPGADRNRITVTRIGAWSGAEAWGEIEG